MARRGGGGAGRGARARASFKLRGCPVRPDCLPGCPKLVLPLCWGLPNEPLLPGGSQHSSRRGVKRFT